MLTVTSKDGTTIAYDQEGQGTPLILVGGAMNTRVMGVNPPLVPLLSHRFTVINYDRRGRGDSTDTAPYAVEREVEDIAALIDAAGGSACVYGSSSGAVLAMEAAAKLGKKVAKLAIFEPPFVIDATRAPIPDDYEARINSLVASGKLGDAIKLFMGKGVGVPAIFVLMMQLMPGWKQMLASANTLPYDTAMTASNQKGRPLTEDMLKTLSAIKAPTLVMDGGKSPAWMRNGVKAVAAGIAGAQHHTLEGQTHIVDAKVVAPELERFFGG